MTLVPKIVRSGYQTNTEEPLPNSVDGHATGQRMIVRSQPLRQTQAIQFILLARQFGQGRGGSTLNKRFSGARRVVFATMQNMSNRDPGLFVHHRNFNDPKVRFQQLCNCPNAFSNCHFRHGVMSLQFFMREISSGYLIDSVPHRRNLNTRQRDRVDSDLVDQPSLEPNTPKLLPDNKSGRVSRPVLRIFVQVVACHHRFILTIHIDLHVRRGPQSIVGNHDMDPFPGWNWRFRFDSQSIPGPKANNCKP